MVELLAGDKHAGRRVEVQPLTDRIAGHDGDPVGRPPGDLLPVDVHEAVLLGGLRNPAQQARGGDQVPLAVVVQPALAAGRVEPGLVDLAQLDDAVTA